MFILPLCVCVIMLQVAELKASYEASLAKKDSLENQSRQTTKRLERAHKLTGGLGVCPPAVCLPARVCVCLPLY